MIKTLLDFIEYSLFIFFGFFASKLSYRKLYSFAKFIGSILLKLDTKRKNITLDNISKAFPEKSKDWHKRVMIDSYTSLSLSIIEFLAIRHKKNDELHELIEYKGLEKIIEESKQGKGVLLLSGHFGNWELLAMGAGLFSNIPALIVVKPQSNKFIDKHFNEIRTMHGNRVVSTYKAAREIIHTLKTGGALALLADQSATADRDIFVDFFGRPAATYEAPADLALRFKVKILMGFAVRDDSGKYHVEIFEIPSGDLEYNKEGIKELTRRHVKALEDEIRKHPGHWAWQHRRWKHQPKQDFTIN